MRNYNSWISDETTEQIMFSTGMNTKEIGNINLRKAFYILHDLFMRNGKVQNSCEKQ